MQKFNGDVFNPETLEDPIFEELALKGVADIFATELAVAAIMTAHKSQYSWDVVIKKHSGKLFIDKREEPNMLDLLTVNETSPYNE